MVNYKIALYLITISLNTASSTASSVIIIMGNKDLAGITNNGLPHKVNEYASKLYYEEVTIKMLSTM